MALTSIHFEPVKNGSENHNERKKNLDYVRHDLSLFNESWKSEDFQDIEKTRIEIKEDFLKFHGKNLPAHAILIREGVAVIEGSTTMQQLLEFSEECKKNFGITLMQAHIHRDEGYADKEGFHPNNHSHLIFCWYDMKKHITCKLNRHDMSKLQTLLAKSLNMDRGKSSDKEHLNAIQMKIESETKRLDCLKAKIKETSEIAIGALGAADVAIRNNCKDMQKIGLIIIQSFDKLCEQPGADFSEREKDVRVNLMEKCSQELTGMERRDMMKFVSETHALTMNLTHSVERINHNLQSYLTIIPFFKKRRVAHEAELMDSILHAHNEAQKAKDDAQKKIAEADEEIRNKTHVLDEKLSHLETELDKKYGEGYEAGKKFYTNYLQNKIKSDSEFVSKYFPRLPAEWGIVIPELKRNNLTDSEIEDLFKGAVLNKTKRVSFLNHNYDYNVQICMENDLASNDYVVTYNGKSFDDCMLELNRWARKDFEQNMKKGKSKGWHM